jgi:hypothetical protein
MLNFVLLYPMVSELIKIGGKMAAKIPPLNLKTIFEEPPNGMTPEKRAQMDKEVILMKRIYQDQHEKLMKAKSDMKDLLDAKAKK